MLLIGLRSTSPHLVKSGSAARRRGRACRRRVRLRTNACTSSTLMRPPGPVPVTWRMSTPSSRASRRTDGAAARRALAVRPARRPRPVRRARAAADVDDLAALRLRLQRSGVGLLCLRLFGHAFGSRVLVPPLLARPGVAAARPVGSSLSLPRRVLAQCRPLPARRRAAPSASGALVAAFAACALSPALPCPLLPLPAPSSTSGRPGRP